MIVCGRRIILNYLNFAILVFLIIGKGKSYIVHIIIPQTGIFKIINYYKTLNFILT